MKKLMTALAVCLAAGFAVATGGGVVSSNVVGYYNVSSAGVYSLSALNFEKVGGGVTHYSDLVATGQLTPYLDELQTYDPVNGVFVSVWWDGTGFTDYDTIVGYDPEVTPSTAFITLYGADKVVVAGQVPAGPSYPHSVPSGYSLMGSAYPVVCLLNKFDFSTMAAYTDGLQFYDPVEGVFNSYTWNGSDFISDADGTTVLPNEFAPLGSAFIIYNSSANPITVQQTL